MERAEFERKIEEIKGPRVLAGMNVAIITFTDGERHLVQTWTVECEKEEALYIDVHCNPHRSKMAVAYELIADVQQLNP